MSLRSLWPFGALLVLGASSRASANTEPDEDELDEVPDEGKSDSHPYVPAPGVSPLWPLPGVPRKWWSKSFGGPRPWKAENPVSHHKGIDIHAPRGSAVVAPTDGTMLRSTGWSGNDTRGLIFQSDGGPVLVFGAVAPDSYLRDFPYRVKRGQKVAQIGRYPGGSSMLHLELYRVGSRRRVNWPWGTEQPPSLVNPHKYLLATVNT